MHLILSASYSVWLLQLILAETKGDDEVPSGASEKLVLLQPCQLESSAPHAAVVGTPACTQYPWERAM